VTKQSSGQLKLNGQWQHHTHIYRSWQNLGSTAQGHAIALPSPKVKSNDQEPACKHNVLTILQLIKSSQTHVRIQQTAFANHVLLCCFDGLDATMMSTKYGKDFSALEMGGLINPSQTR